MIDKAIEEKAEYVVQQVTDLWETWKQARQDKEKMWQDCLNNYLVHIDETKFQQWPWRSKVADTFSQETADTIASALRNALFPVTEMFFEVKGEDRYGRDHEREMYEYLDRQLHRLKFIERLTPWFKQLAVIGNGPVLLPWKDETSRQRRRIKEVDPLTKATRYRVTEEDSVTYSGPGLQVLDAVDVVFNPHVMSWAQTPFIRRVLLTEEQVLARFTGIDLSRLDEDAASKPFEDTDHWKGKRAEVFGVDKVEEDKEDTTIEVLEWYGDLVCEGVRYPDYQLAVLNRKILAEAKRNPYWAGRPLMWGTYDDVWFTMLGKGPLEPVRGTQQLIDTFTNQKTDALNIVLNPTFKYVDDGIIDPETMFVRPGGAIEVGNLQNLEQLQMNSQAMVALQEIEMLRARGERSSGASRFDMGQAPGGRRTAFEASIVRQGASSRSMDITKHLANDILEPMLEFMLGCIQQFTWDRRNTEGELKEDALLGRYRINYLGADLTAMQQFRQQQLAMFAQMGAQIPQVFDAMEMPEVARFVVRTFNMDSPEIMKSKDKYQREQEQKRQMEQAEAQAAIGQSGGQMPMQPEPVNEEEAALFAGAGA